MSDVNKFRFNRIYYLNADEENSAHIDLYQTINVNSIYHTESKISVEYHWVNSKKDLREALRKIENEVDNGFYPLIHIACHGNEIGLRLPSKAKVKWYELSNYLLNINLKTRNNLFVAFACCDGAYISLQMIDRFTGSMKSQRTPIFGYVGIIGEIRWGEVEKGYSKFYEELFRSFSTGDMDLDNAISNLDRNTSNPLQCISCIQLFKRVIEGILAQEALSFKSNLALDSRVSSILRSYFRNKGVLPNFQNFHKMRAALLNQELYVHFFNEMRKYYFMIDLYPENEERFEEIEGIANWKEIIKEIR